MPHNTKRKKSLYLVALVQGGIESAPIKIGITQNLKGRLTSLQTGCPYRLSLHEWWELETHLEEIEAGVHEMFEKDRMSGEWFNIKPDLARCFIEASFWLELAIAGEYEMAKAITSFGSRARAGELIEWRAVAQAIALESCRSPLDE
jgi:hypothetical protein